MKKILSIALLFISIISHAQPYTPIHAVGSATYLDSNRGSALVSHDFILLQYKTKDSTQVLGIDSNGYIVLRTKGGGTAVVDTGNIATHFYVNSQGFLKAADIAGKLNKSDSNILGGYQSRYLWLADSALIMSNFALYVRYQDTANMLNPYLRKADATATYYLLTNPAGYITNIPVADTANSIRVWANGQFYLASNPNNYTDNTPLIDTAAAHLALINSKVSLAKHTTDSIQYYLTVGDTSAAIRAYIAGLPNFGISTTDIGHWNTAYNKYITAVAFNKTTGALTVTLNDATTVTANLDGRYTLKTDLTNDSIAFYTALNDTAIAHMLLINSKMSKAQADTTYVSYSKIPYSTKIGVLANQSFAVNSMPSGFNDSLNNGGTVTFNGSYTTLSNGAGDFANTIFWSRPSNLEYIKVSASLKVTSLGAGISIGKKSSVTATGPASSFATFRLDALDTIKIQNIQVKNLITNATGATYSVSIGDSIQVTWERQSDYIIATLFNYTQNYNVSVTYRYNLTAVSAQSTPNTGIYAIYMIGGTQNLYNFSISSTDNYSPLTVFTGNSIQTGYISGGIGYRCADQVYNNVKQYYDVIAGYGDDIVDAMQDTTEVISVNPKYVVADVGIVDAINNFDTTLFESHYNTYCSAFLRNGITPIAVTCIPNFISDMRPYNRRITKVASDLGLTLVDLYTPLDSPGSTKPYYIYAGDNVHPSPAGHLKMAQTIQTQAPQILKDTATWNAAHIGKQLLIDRIRMNVPQKTNNPDYIAVGIAKPDGIDIAMTNKIPFSSISPNTLPTTPAGYGLSNLMTTTKYISDSARFLRQGGDNRNTPDSIGTKDLNGIVFLVNGAGMVFINSSGLVSVGAPSDGASGMYVSGHKIRANLSSPNQNVYEGGYNGNTYYLMLGDGSATFGSSPATANAYQLGITPFSNTKIGLVVKDFDTTTSVADLAQFQSQTGRILSKITHTGGAVWGDTVKVNAFQYLTNTPAYISGGDSMLVKNTTTGRTETIQVIAYVDSIKRIGDTVWYYKAGSKIYAFTDSLASGGGSGTVTSIATSKGILGGTITTTGTLTVDTVGTSGTAVATQAWVTNKSYLTSYTETDPLYTANGLKKSDTASLVVSYARLNTAQANDVKYTDTVGMSNRINLRIPYADTSVEIATIAYGNVHWGGSSIDTTALSNRINLKQNFTDTAAWDATRAWVNSKGYLTTNQTVTLSGDVTGSGGTAITTTLKNTGTAGTYGDATHVPQFTTDAQGRVTAVTSVAISGGGGGGSGELLNIQYLKTGTTYTPTTGTNTIVIDMVGGGGGGGAVPASSSSSSSGSGGGAGGRLIKRITSVSGTYTYSIGGGGAGGVAGTNNGSTGGNTTFVNGATTYTAYGGGGGYGDGTHTSSIGASQPGGSGGAVSTNGDINTGGMPGNPGFTFTTTYQSSGTGGSTLYGGGGVGMVTITGAGNNATGYGAGGGGAASSVISTTAKAGGNGTQGIIIVYEYN